LRAIDLVYNHDGLQASFKSLFKHKPKKTNC
jgi:hypothetical protein